MIGKKILVIGCPGSGKSTFSKKLSDILKIPLYHLDLLFWNRDRTRVTRKEFHKRLDRVLSEDAFIIDGNYENSMEKRIVAGDTVIFLDYPISVCLEGIRSRVGTLRDDLPWQEETLDAEFYTWVSDYPNRSRPKVTELLSRYPEKKQIILSSRGEGEEFLKMCKKQSSL